MIIDKAMFYVLILFFVTFIFMAIILHLNDFNNKQSPSLLESKTIYFKTFTIHSKVCIAKSVLTITFYIFQITGKEMCSLSKEEFLSRAPAFMGDILWAHLEILQKDVDRGQANIENVPSNYTDSFAIPENFQRTYTQLDSIAAVSQGGNAVTEISANRPQYTQRSLTGCYPTSTADYISNNGSTVDSSSEFSYQMTDIKYSPQQQQQQINNGRVPAYPPTIVYDQFGAENMWPYQPATPLPPQQGHEAWHQPHEYPPTTTPPMSSAALVPPTSTTTPMHHHPAFLQVS